MCIGMEKISYEIFPIPVHTYFKESHYGIILVIIYRAPDNVINSFLCHDLSDSNEILMAK